MTPRTLHTYTVTPSLPPALQNLRELAYNLRWAWDAASIRLFRALGGDPLWEQSGHNPAKLLGLVPQARLDAAAQDAAFLAQLGDVYQAFRAYMDGPMWWDGAYKTEFSDPNFRIAYFSAEFGITECLPIYSGGLGVLAGDHLKSASDLGLPLVGVGFLYQNGYFRQSLNGDGWQIENYPTTDFYSLPIEPVPGGEKREGDLTDHPFTIDVNFPGRQVHIQVWKAQVGRIPLFLLDTNLPQNSEADRHIAGNLYGGDNETRIQQEIILGIGGIHALAAMGIKPAVCHMNEGHSAFLSLERVRRLAQEKGLSFADASEAAAAGNLFTTHTPVPAGFDKFPPELMAKYFTDYAFDVKLPAFADLMDRGRVAQGDASEKFNMAVLAFRQARYINGVSKLHGEVTRKMVQPNWPDYPLDEVPVGSVTNGIHTRSFLSGEMADLQDKYLGEATAENLASVDFWAKVDTIPDAELWQTHELRREKLVTWARKYQEARMEKRGASDREIQDAREILDPKILTIGFARRFATYKRGDLLLRDVERIKRILNNTDRPVQFVFAGKAHPKDDSGKELIRHIVHFAKGEDVRRKIVFLEDYDMAMARYLVEGVDVWLNNPRRPHEASGTSGMKVIANGGLNFSILDGWWAEGYDPAVGWEIGRGDDYEDEGYQDHVEAEDIYETLERSIVPLFYDRGTDGLPHGWISKVKASMKKLAPVFTTARMVKEYAETYYVPAARREAVLAANDYAVAKELVSWKKKSRPSWATANTESVQNAQDNLASHQAAQVHVVVSLGTLTPSDVAVQFYGGPIDADRSLETAHTVLLTCENPDAPAGPYRYSGPLPTEQSGQQGFTVRVLPYHKNAVLPQELPLIAWE